MAEDGKGCRHSVLVYDESSQVNSTISSSRRVPSLPNTIAIPFLFTLLFCWSIFYYHPELSQRVISLLSLGLRGLSTPVFWRYSVGIYAHGHLHVLREIWKTWGNLGKLPLVFVHFYPKWRADFHSIVRKLTSTVAETKYIFPHWGVIHDNEGLRMTDYSRWIISRSFSRLLFPTLVGVIDEFPLGLNSVMASLLACRQFLLERHCDDLSPSKSTETMPTLLMKAFQGGDDVKLLGPRSPLRPQASPITVMKCMFTFAYELV